MSISTASLAQSWPSLVDDKYRPLAKLIAEHDWHWLSAKTLQQDNFTFVDYQMFMLCKVVFNDWKLNAQAGNDQDHPIRFKISPIATVDQVWHEHMLNPMNYVAFCSKVLKAWLSTEEIKAAGEMLLIDHSPSFAEDNVEMKLRRHLNRMDCLNRILLSPKTVASTFHHTTDEFKYRQEKVKEEIELHRLLGMQLETVLSTMEPVEIDVIVDVSDDDIPIEENAQQRKKPSTHHFGTSTNTAIELTLKSMLGKRSIHSGVNPSTTTVFKLKEMIQDREGIPPDQLRFVFGGKQLEDSRYLSDYGIVQDCTIDYTLNLRGC